MPLPEEQPYSEGNPPEWSADLKDRVKPNAYLRVDELGELDGTSDPRDELATEMAELKRRKLQGEMQQRRLRAAAAQRGLAPSGRTVRTTSNRGTFFAVEDNPDSTLRPVDPQLVEEGEVAEDAQQVYTAKYRRDDASSEGAHRYDYGGTQVMDINSPADGMRQVYDGYHDTSTYIPAYSRQDEVENAMSTRRTAAWKPRRFGWRKFGRVVLIVALIGMLGYVGYRVYPLLATGNDEEARTVTVTATIRDDLAAHTITIPGEDGQRISIRELRTSAIVTDGVATFDILDHIWYDDFEDYLQETMAVTLTPYIVSDSGKQVPLDAIHYEIDIPLSPIELVTPDTAYKEVSTPMFTIVIQVREGSTLLINGEDYSDLVNTDGGRVSYNATVQPTGENKFVIVVRSQYCRENSMELTLYREKQEIPLDLQSDIGTRSTSKTMLIRASTLPGAVVNVLSAYTDLDITTCAEDGAFSFYAVFNKIGDNTIVITADYPDRATSRVEYSVYYVPSIDDYSKAAWAMDSDHYYELLNNLDIRKEKTTIYVCKGTITSIETTKPQRAYMNCGTEADPIMIYIENSSRTSWEVGDQLRLYADVFGMYNSLPWLICRYTYGIDEYY